MTMPGSKPLFRALDKTWPPIKTIQVEHWTIRAGQGGGRRVSATTGSGCSLIEHAEKAMSGFGQPNLFMIRDGDQALDQELDARGYVVDAPTSVFCCPIEAVAGQSVEPLSGFAIWPPLAIMNEIWENGGINHQRRAVMNRVPDPKTAIFGRINNRAAGTAFLAIHQNIAMIHAIEVAPAMRRMGVGINILRFAAQWAQDTGAAFLALMVTDTNPAAIALYKKLGMTVVGHYHYRIER